MLSGTYIDLPISLSHSTSYTTITSDGDQAFRTLCHHLLQVILVMSLTWTKSILEGPLVLKVRTLLKGRVLIADSLRRAEAMASATAGTACQKLVLESSLRFALMSFRSPRKWTQEPLMLPGAEFMNKAQAQGPRCHGLGARASEERSENLAAVLVYRSVPSGFSRVRRGLSLQIHGTARRSGQYVARKTLRQQRHVRIRQVSMANVSSIKHPRSKARAHRKKSEGC